MIWVGSSGGFQVAFGGRFDFFLGLCMGDELQLIEEANDDGIHVIVIVDEMVWVGLVQRK